MAINLKFDLMGNPEPPSIILANRNGNKLGQLDVNVESIDVKDALKTSEFTFTLNKYVDGKLTNLWDKVIDFKLVYCPEWDLWYSIKVELDEATETVKTVFCTQLGQEELSQIMVYNIEINTEADISRDDYKISILYDEDNPDASILHRVMSKAPHYSIAYIDESLKRLQRSFSFDGASICDVLDEIEEEVGCLVVYNSNSDENGMPKRDISIYDLEQNCKNPNCKHRGEFTDKCPKCGGTDINYGYGEDTTIFVTSDELATQGISLTTDTDSVKNCFKLEAGDDLMTATIRNCNPNGSDYIWYFSDAIKEDMSEELVKKIEDYDDEYKYHYNDSISNVDEALLNDYNALVEKYREYYNTPSICLNCDYEGNFDSECPQCGSGNILLGKSLQSISTPITGYSALMNAYYNTIDLALYLKSGLMPSIEMSDTNAEEQAKLLTSSSLSPVAVANIDTVSLATANSAVLAMAKIIVRSTFKVQVNNSELSTDKKTWTGNFVITNYSDEEDAAISDTVSVSISGDSETFIRQKIEKALNKENTDDYSISGLFEKEYDDFCNELKKYALNPLIGFCDACQSCIDILMEQGVGDDTTSDLYKNLYDPYYNKLMAIEAEIKIREEEINLIVGVYDIEGNLITEGLQTNIESCKSQIQEALNFENYLGEKLWFEFCSYRREDKYSNNNYISDGLNNAELFEKANEFIKVAEEEIFKSAELQHSISATLNNLLSHPKFKPLIKYFKTGNWIRVQVDDRIFKLRLLEYNFNYGDLENIPVEFSDITKIKNGTTDVQSAIAQASSMASSYDSVQRQAKKGDVARSTIDQWLIDGLNTANVQIQNNDNEEVIIAKNGLLARSYSDITGEYSPEQLKITHNIMAYTDNNWKTVKQAIGKHSYKFYDQEKNGFVDGIGYGVTTEFVDAGYVTGSQIIGGDIYSDNYSITNRTGSYINLRDGTFSFAGGSLRYDGKDLLISSPNVLTKNEVTTINEEYLKTATVYAENLQVRAANIQEKLTASQINTTGLIAENISSTTIEGKTITGGSLFIGDKNNNYAEITSNGVLNAKGANVDGVITATSGSFTNCIIDNTCKISGELSGATGTFSGTISASIIKGSTIEGGSLHIGNDESGYYAWISEDGVLNAEGANISGAINATEGKIGGWGITSDVLYKNICGLSSGMCSIIKESEGLEYTLSKDGASYIVKSIGSCEDTEIVIPSVYKNKPVTSISYCAFAGCTNLISIAMSNSVTNIDACAFENCTNLINAVIPNSVTSIGCGAFEGCSSLTNITLPFVGKTKDGTENTHFGYVFGALSYGENNDYVPTSLKVVTITNEDSIAPRAFSYCSSLTSIEIPNSVTSIGGSAFRECTSLTSVTIPNSVTSISGSAFADCTSLKDVTIGNSVTSIGNYAFDNCTKLESLEIPSSVTTMGEDAFRNCSSLTIYCEAESQPSGWDSGWNSQGYPDAVWGCDNNNIKDYNSLFINGITSYPRFFAGSNSDIPNSINDAKFLVLEDGSLYTSAAKISGGNIGGWDITDNALIKTTNVYDMMRQNFITTWTLSDDITFSHKDAHGSSNTYSFDTYMKFGWMGGTNVGYEIVDGKAYQRYGIKTNSNLSFQVGANRKGELLGTWKLSSGAEITSDRNEKHNIELLPEVYEKIFDNLHPVRFKYNEGTSNRFHTGFIAQEVEDAVLSAGLTTQDFAAICYDLNEDGNKINYGVRYDEFVSMNTYEIQKLKKRVAELENKLKELK